jgi:pimeloyl-ACP methyl ester carboxylesterase
MKTLYRTPAGEQAVMEFYNQAMAYWPGAHQELRVPTRLGETFLLACGQPSAEPVVLLHGASSNALSWMGDAPLLASRLRVYVPDIPGDPGRSAPSRPDWNGPAYTEWLEDVLEAVDVQKVNLVGLSQGGWQALKFAVNHPERVSRLVLLSPAGVTRDRSSFLLKAVLYSLAGKKGAQALTRLTFGRLPVSRQVIQYQDLIMTHFRSRISRLNLFTDSELRRLDMPVLLIGGKQDAIRDVSGIQRRLGALTPRLQSHIYPDQGHVLINQSAVILPFLSKAA